MSRINHGAVRIRSRALYTADPSHKPGYQYVTRKRLGVNLVVGLESSLDLVTNYMIPEGAAGTFLEHMMP